MITPKFNGVIKEGKLYFDKRDLFDIYIGSLSDNKKVEIIVRPVRKGRSDKVNNYYWAYINIISIETGNDSRLLHEYFKNKYLPPTIGHIKGKEIKIPPTTTTLSSFDMSNYMEKISIETDIPLMDPNEYYNQ